MPFPATIDLSTLDGSTGFRLDGVDAFDRSGVSVAGAGDVNGDGLDDFIIGAYGVGGSTGASYLVFGQQGGFADSLDLATLDGTNGFRLIGTDTSDASGFSVAGAGDVNGDGFADIIIGARGADPNGSYSGASYVIFGQASGFAADLALASLDGNNGYRIAGINPGDGSGFSVSGAGDVNGDGFDDVIIGARSASPNGNSLAGQSYVVFGHTGGFDASQNLSDLDGTNGFRIDGIDADDLSGISVAGIGDVNDDGFDDVLVGASFGDPNGDSGAGESYVIYGTDTGFAASLVLSELDGSNGFRLDGIDALDSSGHSVARAGDVNGDGIADFIIGAHFADPGGLSSAGETYVVFGNASGFAAAVDLTGLNGTAGFRIDGIDPSDRSGISVAGAGDVNGDGFDDIIVGAFYADAGGDSNAGESYVIFGKADGFAAGISLASLDGSNGFRIDGVDVDDFSGRAVAGAGDVNGDGFDDILIGARGGDPNGDSFAGESYIVFGIAPDAAVTRTGSAASQTISGGAFNDVLSGLDGNDILRGGAGNDRMDGGQGADTADYSDATSAVRIDLNRQNVAQNTLGGGFDTLVSIEYLTGSAFADTLFGNAGNNRIYGGDGLDRIVGGDGNDMLYGDGGNDVLVGGLGVDAMRGGTGDDRYDVREAGDTVIEAANEGADTVQAFVDFTLGANIERLELFGNARVGTGNAIANTIFGGNGGDTLSGLGGNDVLRGQASRDTLLGGDGDDTLDGGAGKDTITGGAGRDSFQFRDGDTIGSRVNCDIITDFDQGANERIQLALVDANTVIGGNQDFEWIGTGAFTDVAGQLRYQQVNGNTFIEGDLNGDGVSDYTIQLTGLYTLDTSDFTGVADLFP